MRFPQKDSEQLRLRKRRKSQVTLLNSYNQNLEGKNNAVTAAMVKELREMTGAGMMGLQKALAATDGDMDKAVEFLREKGLAGALRRPAVLQLKVS